MGSAGAPLLYTHPPLPFSSPPPPTYLYPSESHSSSVSDVSSPVLNLDPSGLPLTFKSALAGPYRSQWLRGSDNELIKLVATTRTLCPVHFASSTPTYYNPVAKEKWSPLSLLQPGTLRSPLTGVDRRVRGTAGGDRLPSSCPPSTHVASLPTVNILFNSVVSDDAHFGTIDLTDFYLGTILPVPQFIKIYVHQFSPEVLSSLSLLSFIKLDSKGKQHILFRIDKTMYGLKEAGKLSNTRGVNLLSSFGFFETTTPCLFKHVSRDIVFVLVVDDFGVKYHNRVDFDYLVSCLTSLYHVKAHPTGSKFLGFHLQHDRTARTLSVSYPGYIQTLLTRLRPNGVAPASSPSLYTAPSYGSRAPQSPTGPDISPLASSAQSKDLQVAIGYLLYYGRCVDARMLPAVCSLASEQAVPTSATMLRLDRLLGYASSHPNGRKVYRASDMILRVLSDASYLSRPKAGSVAGSHHFLGHRDDDEFLNHPISNHSTRIPVVCSFVAEAEYAGLYAAARIAVDERRILTNMGHPQPPTTIFCDNEVAIGLANNTVTPKMSKSLDMRFHWLQDRVRQGQFRIVFVPGLQNLADFFTKALPVSRHQSLAPFIAFDDGDNDDDNFQVKLKLSTLLFAAACFHPAPSGCVNTTEYID